MKKRVLICASFCVSIALLGACGKSEMPAAPASDEVISDAESTVEDSEISDSEDTFVPAEDVPTTADGGDEELPEYLQIDPIDQTLINEDVEAGEGVSVLVGDIVTLKDDAKELKIGETVTIETSYGDYELTVDEISLTDERNPDDVQEVPSVVLLKYSYKNTNYDDSFILGDVSFKVLDDKDQALAPYFFTSSDDEEYPAAEPVKKGESAEVSVGYALYEKTTRIRVVFDNLIDENGVEYYWDVDV